MSSEHSRVEVRFGADQRLAAAASAAADGFTQRLGMPLGPRAAFVAAVEESCNSTFRLLDDENAEICVSLADFDDRVEATIEYPGQPLPSIGLESFAVLDTQDSEEGQPIGLMLLTLVDRVQYQTVGGKQRVTLVKNLQQFDKE